QAESTAGHVSRRHPPRLSGACVNAAGSARCGAQSNGGAPRSRADVGNQRRAVYTGRVPMQTILRLLLILGRLLGIIQITVGLALWLGWLPRAVAFHTAAGSLLVLVLWTVALIALFALSSRSIPLVALFWGGLVLWLGMAQMTILNGSAHWTIRVAHFVIGLAAIGFIESLVKATRRHWSPRSLSASAVLLLAVTLPANAQSATCSDAPRRPITMVDVPGNPFQALPSADGCWVFVSLARPRAGAPASVALLRRDNGTLSVVRVQPVD